MRVVGVVSSCVVWAVVVATGCSPRTAPEPPSVRTFMVPMRDGVRLATDVYFPSSDRERHPVILLRTPYNRAWLADYGRYYSGHGYAFVIQDVRGRFESGGEWEPFVHEGEDGYDTIEWLAGQEWSTGKVGMIGGSYSGSAQFAAAIEKPPHLVTIVPNITPAIPFDNLPYEGGVLLLGWAIRWVDIMENAHTGREFAARLQAATREDWSARLDRLPVADLDVAVAGKRTPYWRRWLEHSSLDGYWDAATYLDQLGDVDIPVFLQSGWFDGGTRGTKLAYRQLARGGNENLRMILGPWAHSDRGSRLLNGMDMGPEAEVDLFERYRRWFDRWLEGESTGQDDGPPVELYLMHSNRWLRGETYPLPGTRITRFCLSDPSDTSSARIDGSLSASCSRDATAVDAYSYDPSKPTPSFYAHMKRGELTDYRSRMLSHDDALLYETPPLERPLHLAGPVEATIYASSSARDTDWSATLYGVAEDGQIYPIGLTFGMLRARYRESPTDPRLLEPGVVYEFPIDLGHTAVTLPAGHRLRLEIASSSFPEYSRNLNTGGDNELETRFIVADQRVYRGGEFPSHVSLPVVSLESE
jgi:putative CocE/NonD family hydrolase